MDTILILVETNIRSRRLAYVLSQMNNFYAGIRFVLEANGEQDFIIGYGVQGRNEDVYIPAHSFIQEGRASPKTLESSGVGENAIVFEMRVDVACSSLDFDIFAAIFFLLSRAEEYDCDNLDMHGRYMSQNSWLYQVDALNYPMVEIWTCRLISLLLEESKSSYAIVPNISEIKITLDVDMPWYEKYIPLSRKILRKVKYLFLTKPKFQQNHINEDDPYDTFEAMIDVFKKYQVSPLWFLLLSSKTRHDAIQSVDNKNVLTLFRELGNQYSLGIHPSYSSSDSDLVLESELRLYERLGLNNNAPDLHSRQHFLRFRIPQTYTSLIRNGVTDEYSMGYADTPGYRAGTSFPFHWYDMRNEIATSMKIHPLVVMDVSLADYNNLSPSDALGYYTHFANMTKKYGGEMIFLWHNSFFTHAQDIDSWWDVFVETCKMSEDFHDKGGKIERYRNF